MDAILSSRITLAVAGLVGMAMCSAGIGRVAAQNRWLDPLSFVGYLLGVAALGIIGAGLFGLHLPGISDQRTALIALVVIIVAKVALTAVHGALA